jgi:hypothetical protein
MIEDAINAAVAEAPIVIDSGKVLDGRPRIWIRCEGRRVTDIDSKVYCVRGGTPFCPGRPTLEANARLSGGR